MSGEGSAWSGFASEWIRQYVGDKGTGYAQERERERGEGIDEQGDEEQDYRANREALVVDRLSACLYEPLLPVYVLFTPRSIDLSTSVFALKTRPLLDLLRPLETRILDFLTTRIFPTSLLAKVIIVSGRDYLRRRF